MVAFFLSSSTVIFFYGTDKTSNRYLDRYGDRSICLEKLFSSFSSNSYQRYTCTESFPHSHLMPFRFPLFMVNLNMKYLVPPPKDKI
jgi:hypothetical protein